MELIGTINHINIQKGETVRLKIRTIDNGKVIRKAELLITEEGDIINYEADKLD